MTLERLPEAELMEDTVQMNAGHDAGPGEIGGGGPGQRHPAGRAFSGTTLMYLYLARKVRKSVDPGFSLPWLLSGP